MGASMANFIQSVREISRSVAAMPGLLAGPQQRARPRARFVVGLAELENCKLALLSITPGLAICALMRAAPATTCVGAQHLADALGTLDAVLKGEDRRPVADKAGRSCSAALSVSASLTAKMMASAVEISAHPRQP